MSKGKQVVSTVFKAKDKISSAFKRMGRNSDRFGKGAEQAFKKASRSAKTFDKVTKGILKASVIQKTFSLMSQGVSAATSEFISFDDALFSAAAKFSDVDLTTKKGQETFKKLGEAARKTGKMTQFSAAQAAQGLDFLALAGFNAQQSMAALPGLADLATAAGIDDFARVVDIASDSLGAFGMATKDAAQLEKNLTRVSDIFAKTQAKTNTNIEQLFEAVTKGAPAFTAAGQKLKTFAALTGVLANSGVKGSEAGTNLRNVMLRLGNATPKASKELARMGIRVKDADGNFRNIIDILDDFQKGLKGAGTAQKTQTLATIFGARAITGINILLKEGTKSLKKWEQAMDDAGGTSKTIAGIMRQSLGNRLKSLGSAALEMAFKFLDAFKVKGVNSIDALTKAIREVDVQPLVDAVKDGLSLFSSIFKLVRSLTVIMSPLIAAWVTYKSVVLATTVITGAYAAVTGIITAIKNATIAWTVAQWALNVALTANPIGLIIAGVALLITGIVLLVKKWDTVKKAFVEGGKAILNIFSKVWGFVKRFLGLGGGIFSSIFGGDEKVKGNEKAAPGETGSGVFAPPNRREASAASQRFEGIFKFQNMPDNVTFEQKSIGAPLISTAELGAN